MSIADPDTGGGSVGGKNHALVQAGPVRIDGQDRGPIVIAVRVERLADDRPSPRQAGMGNRRDHRTIHSCVQHLQ